MSTRLTFSEHPSIKTLKQMGRDFLPFFLKDGTRIKLQMISMYPLRTKGHFSITAQNSNQDLFAGVVKETKTA